MEEQVLVRAPARQTGSKSNSVEKEQFPSSKQAWLTCSLLGMLCAVAMIDRMIVNLLIIPIQTDLHVTDTQISLLVGMAFSSAHALMSLPLARWIDRGNRRNIIATCLALWSTMTMACGLATNLVIMFIARVCVGGSESALHPAATSMIGDLFSTGKRSTAIGIIYAGVFIGSGSAYLIGGFLLRMMGPGVEMPFFGFMPSWRAVFIVIGAIGLVLLPIALLVREPARLNGTQPTGPVNIPIREVLGFVRARSKTFFPLIGGFTLLAFTAHAGNSWLPTIMVRSLGWSLSEAGAALGTLLLIFGPLGSLSGGLAADFLARRGRADASLIVTIYAALACAICSLGVSYLKADEAVLASVAAYYYFGTFGFGLAFSSIMGITPNGMRGQMTSAYSMVSNIIAGTASATLVALLTDYVFVDPAKVNYSFSIVSSISACGCAFLLFLSRRKYVKDAI